MKAIVGLALGVAVFTTGCAKESPPGGPGAANPKPAPGTPGAPGTPAAPATSAEANKNTFTLKVPGTDTNIKQGESDDVTLTISRGSEFKQPVKLMIEAPAGLTATPTEVSLPATDSEAKVKIAVDAGTAVGPQMVKVTATPETGKEVSETFTVDVKEK